jgi:RecJ-like exonuclease
LFELKVTRTFNRNKMQDKETETLMPFSSNPNPAAKIPCPHCGGAGRIVLLTSSGPCEHCGGSGVASIAASHAITTIVYQFDDLDLKEDPPAVEEMASCNHCAGGGRRDSGSCPTCNGRGVVRRRTTTIRDKQGRVRAQWREYPDLEPVYCEYESYSTDEGTPYAAG